MRRVGGLFERITSFENLLAAARAAYRGKRFRPAPAEFQHGLEPNLLELQEELRSGGYWPGPYRAFWIHDPKRRRFSQKEPGGSGKLSCEHICCCRNNRLAPVNVHYVRRYRCLDMLARSSM